jgi:hypothetical protein
LAIAASILVGLITIIWPEAALFLLIFSMLLSPEISVAEIPRRSVTIRIEDLLLVTVFFVWLVKSTVQRGRGFIVKTPLNLPIAVYIVVCLLSTAFFIMRGDIIPIRNFFYLLKYVEYFLLYTLVSSLVNSRRQIKVYLWAGLITAIIVSLYAYFLVATITPTPRLYAPFDYDVKGGGEPATLGGYLMIMYCMSLGFFLQHTAQSFSVFMPLYMFFMLTPFILTLSRASYVALSVSVMTALVMSTRRRFVLFLALTFGVVLFPILTPRLYNSAKERLMETFQNPF